MSTINIDFGQGSPPAQFYAGAGTAGYWNSVTRVTSTGIVGPSLLDINRQATGVMITTSQSMSGVTPSSQPFSTADSGLLGDYIVSGLNTFSMNILGLPQGLYEFVIYATGRQDFPQATTIIPDGDTGAQKAVTGIYSGGLSEGVTHATIIRSVGSSGVSFQISSPADGFINGMQISPIPEPGAALLLGISLLAAASRRKRIGEQGGAGQPATRFELDSEGGDKPQPETEGRSR